LVRQTRGDDTARLSEAFTAESPGETGIQGESVSMETAYIKSRKSMSRRYNAFITSDGMEILVGNQAEDKTT